MYEDLGELSENISRGLYKGYERNYKEILKEMTTKTEEYCANEDILLKCNKISKEDWGQYLIQFSKMTEKIQQKNTAEYKSKYLKNTEQDGEK